MNNKLYTATAIILTIATIAMMMPNYALAAPQKNTKEINCDDCTLRFSGKNDVTVKFNAGNGGGQGQTGPMGPAGKDGKDGIDGKDGKDGKDGVNGTNGKDGKDGVNGTNGISGVSGTNGTMLDNQTINNLQYVNDNIDTIKALVNAWNDGTLGVPSEVNETGNVTTPPVANETEPPIANETVPPVSNETGNVTVPVPPVNVTVPENVSGNLPINVTGNLTVPGGNFSGDVNVTLPNASEPIGPQESNQSGNVTPTNFVGSVFTQLFG